MPAEPTPADVPFGVAVHSRSVGVHKARPLLPQLIKDAEQGTVTELTRGEESVLLISAAHAGQLGLDLAGAPAFGVAEARPALGDLVAQAAAGTPQVLRRHKTPVAVLIPAAAAVPATPTIVADSPTAPPAAAAPAPASPETVPTAPASIPVADAVSAPPAPAPRTATEPPSAPSQLPGTTPTTQPASSATAPRRVLAALGDVLDTVLPPAQPGQDTHAATSAGTARPGLSTGIDTLDRAIGGLQPGRLYLVAGAPGTGSSLIATAAARATALTHRRPVLYAASGLTRQDVAARVIAAHTPVDYRRLRAQALTEQERQAVADTAQLLAAAPLLIDDGTGLDAAALTDTAADVPDLALLVVDRLQAARDPRLPLSGPAAIRDAVQALAHLARTRHLPVLAALDTDDPTLLRTLAADLTLTLEPHRPGTRHGENGGDQVRLAITERDLGTLATITLAADLVHARLTDPPAPGNSPAPEAPNTPSTASRNPTLSAQTTGNTPPLTPANTPDSPSTPLALAPGPAPEMTATAPGPATPAPDDQARSGSLRPTRSAAVRTPGARSAGAAGGGGGEYAGRDYGYHLDMISSAVEQTLAEHGGDTEAAIAALENKAIPSGMALFDATRVGAAYEHTVYPERLDFLSKKSRDGADDIWEGRHKWENTPLMAELKSGTRTSVDVDVLDTNAAYCSAFKTYLPIGALVHDPNGGFDPKRSGIYLLPQRPVWEHTHLPDPIGGRREAGPVLLDDATVRLLIRCHKLGLTSAPHITEAWTSGASESLLEKFRRVLTLARETAIQDGDIVTERYVKAIYAKFVSTIGESTYNREMRRPEWMHIIRSQAFANLWYKAHRAHTAGLTIVRLRGTDELHVTGGDWRTVFTEGRLTTQMKLKDQYTLPLNRKAA